jgi:hypothetical protein
MEVAQIIAADDPDEACVRRLSLQRADQVDRVARAEPRLDVGHDNSRPAEPATRRRQPVHQRCLCALQRIAR